MALAKAERLLAEAAELKRKAAEHISPRTREMTPTGLRQCNKAMDKTTKAWKIRGRFGQ